MLIFILQDTGKYQALLALYEWVPDGELYINLFYNPRSVLGIKRLKNMHI